MNEERLKAYNRDLHSSLHRMREELQHVQTINKQLHKELDRANVFNRVFAYIGIALGAVTIAGWVM